jgi:hypothetical protein
MSAVVWHARCSFTVRGSALCRMQKLNQMLGRVYTFERDAEKDSFPAHELVSQVAIDALVFAINQLPGLRYEELTDFENIRPMFAVSFANEECMKRFDHLIGATLKIGGLKVAAMQEYHLLDNIGVRSAKPLRAINEGDAASDDTPRAA